MPINMPEESLACVGACAVTGIELAETVVLYLGWLAWCVETFCED